MSSFEALKSFELPFGTVDVHKRFVVVTLDKGADRQPEPFYAAVGEIVLAEFTEPWGYVGNRANGTAADPSLLARAKMQMPLFCSFAVVAYSHATVDFFNLEKSVLGPLPNALFFDLEEALEWTHRIVGEARREAISKKEA